ncbi:hypothetical protein DPMN_097048 [Dreissena polymorpha]|uniref:Uncharacterized protein n=1 Tax=Dreissena polymorpha TaxID=45954 RepID=A0A9D4R605_DREPO|nr:hypothetical protein DPMN_097048 [Dreissena polymorpha]
MSEMPVWIVLNSAALTQCTNPPPVLPSIKYLLLDEVTCSSTVLHSMLRTLVTRGHHIKSMLTRCKITSCSEKEVGKIYIKADVSIVTDLTDTFSLTDIQGTVHGMWEACHGFNINKLDLSVPDGKPVEAQYELFSQLLLSFTQLKKTFY